MDYPFYILDIDDNDNLSGVDAVGLVEHPAIELGWMAFSNVPKMKFEVQDETEQILAGALMVANLPIPRMDEKGDVFFVTFPPEVIKRIVYKIKANGVQLKFNIGHDETKTIEAVLVSDFLVSEKMGMQAPAWHKPLSEGSWFGFVKIPNKEDYEWAKENLTGFSIEGIFDQIKYADVDETIIDKIKQNMSKLKQVLGSDAYTKLKKFFSEDEPKKEEEEVKMGEATLEDGTVIKWEGELMQGTAISVVTENGEAAAPDDTHILSDGTKVTTENGLVTSIEEVVTETVEEVVASAIEPIATELASLTEKFSAMQKELVKVNQVNKQMFEALEVLAKQEPEEPKLNSTKQQLKLMGKLLYYHL
jgi:hypothetical protein